MMQTVVRLNATKCASSNREEHQHDADCAVFTGAGSRPCNTSEPLWWAVLRILKRRPTWCSTAHDLASPLYLETTRYVVPEIRDHDRVGVVRYGAGASVDWGCDGGGYGVWFFVMPGSEVEVEVGRILSFNTKAQSLEFMRQQMGTRNATSYTPPCARWNSDAGPRCDQHSDVNLCEAVRRVGRDSVLIRNVNYGYDAIQPVGTRMELILCEHGRIDDPQCDACLPWDVVPLHNASSGRRYKCSAGEWRIPFGYGLSRDEAASMRSALTCDKTACAATALAGAAFLLAGIVCVGVMRSPCRSAHTAAPSTTTPLSVRQWRSRYIIFDKGTSPPNRVRWLSGTLIALVLMSSVGGMFLSVCAV